MLLGVDCLVFVGYILNENNILNSIRFVLMSWCYYYIAGYIIEDVFETRKSRNIIIILGILSLVIRIVLTRCFQSFDIKELNPFMTIQAFGFYFLLLDFVKIKSDVVKNAISLLAQHSFIFYLAHYFMMKRICLLFDLEKSFKLNIVNGLSIFIISFICVSMISIFIDNKIIYPLRDKYLKIVCK